MTEKKPVSRIDFIITALSGGGAERVMVILANNLVLRGYKVSLITFNESVEGDDSYQIDSKIRRIKLHGGKFKNHKIRSLNNLLGYYRQKSNQPDVIISFLSLTNLITILVAKFYGMKIIASEHINHLQREGPGYLTDFTRRFLYRKANFITVLTAYDVEYYESRGSKVVVMPNPTTFLPIEDNNHSREKTILAVGNLNRYHHKGFDNLLKLIKPVLIKHPDWSLKIIGGGEKGDVFLKSLAKELSISDTITFTGFQDNVKEHMRNASIFILSSRFEGLPMVILEAMSQGMACIAYNCVTGPSDIISNYENGILIKDQNIEEMKIGLSALIEDKELRVELAKNSVRSLDRFSLENIISKWELLFKKL